MRWWQFRQRPRSRMKLTMGKLSHGLMATAQVGQFEPGRTSERPSGILWMTTFRKLPIASPRTNEIVSTAPSGNPSMAAESMFPRSIWSLGMKRVADELCQANTMPHQDYTSGGESLTLHRKSFTNASNAPSRAIRARGCSTWQQKSTSNYESCRSARPIRSVVESATLSISPVL